MITTALVIFTASGCGEAQQSSGSGSSVHSAARGGNAARGGGDPGSGRTGTDGLLFAGDGDRDNPSDIDGDEMTDSDGEDDSSKAVKGYHDRDDSTILDFGHAASSPDRSAIASLVTRYFVAVSAGDGATACSLMPAALADSLAGDYGSGGPAYLRGGTSCRKIVLLLSKHLRREPVGALQVTDVRVNGGLAYALVGSTSIPASYVSVRRETGIWKIAELASARLP